jgi:uncharacterized membrane protein YdbT with pleckstrin-like domain
MGYAERNLVPGETLVYKTGLHWIVMRWSLFAGLILCALGIVAIGAAKQWTGAARVAPGNEWMAAGAAAVLCGVIVIAVAMIRRSATEMAISNKRVLIKSGFLSRKSIEVLLAKVESIGVNESFIGRVLGYGTVVIRGTGGTFETFDEIQNPNEFRRQVQGQLAVPSPAAKNTA